MFEHIVLRRTETGLSITPGQIAEALLYYQRVHVFVDRLILFDLIKKLGPDGTISLLRRPELSAVYCEEMLGTRTESVGVTQYHSYVAIQLMGHEKDAGILKSPHDRLQYELNRQGLVGKDTKRFTREFLDRVPVRKYSGDHYVKGGIIRAAEPDLSDTEYVKRAIRAAATATAGGYDPGETLEVELIKTDRGVVVFTDLDLDSINQKRAKAVPPVEALTIANLLTSMLDARADLTLASFYGGDFATSDITSGIIQARFAEFLRRSKLNVDSRRQFTEVVLPDSPRLAEVIDSGERSFDEFLNLLDKAQRFKDWLGTVNPDENLLRTYLRDVSSKGWIERLPAKSLRYLLTTGLDVTNPVAGLVSGFVDNFIVEKLFAGWRPNHFVSGKLGPFVKGHQGG